MITEGVILLRIQDLQQCGGRIAAKIGAHFVDLIEHENRIVRSRLFDALDNATGQSADIGAPVAANFRFVAHSTEGHAHKITPERTSDGSSQGGFADSRRADETKNRSFESCGATC